MNHRGHSPLAHARVGGDQAFHKVGQVFRPGAREIDLLFLPGDRFDFSQKSFALEQL